MQHKMALGTVQFGMNYGINNQKGKPTQDEVNGLLAHAFQHGVRCLDTAVAYGDSELVIGKAIRKNVMAFDMITKLPKGITAESVEDTLTRSLEKLHTRNLYACLLHDFTDFLQSPALWHKMRELREEKVVKKIGFSLYQPEQLEKILAGGTDFDIVQVPYSIFDQRFEPFFPLLKENKVEIHVRSIFLQGLFFMDPDSLPSFFEEIKGKLIIIRSISKEMAVSLHSLLLNFACLQPLIDKVVIGVDSLEQLKKNLAALGDAETIRNQKEKLKNLAVSNENILLPFHWKLN